MKKITLKKKEERRIKSGHLWVFSNEVNVDETPLVDFCPGESAVLCSHQGEELGTVYVNPHSLICARIVSHTSGEELNRDLLHKRISYALALRSQLFSLPFYRLCHGEGDFLPGLVIDRYGDDFAVQITTAGMERYKEEIISVLNDLFNPSSIFMQNALASRELEGLPSEKLCVQGTAPAYLTVPENGLQFSVPYLEGQKTGWFFDQRNNRAEFARYAENKNVLDAFCYAGGFGVTAAARGAASVTFIDASKQALQIAERNCLTNAPKCSVNTIHGDALEELVKLRTTKKHFGLISLDPPAFIKRRKDAAKGLAAYRKINDVAFDLLEDGGILATSSCSQHLTTESLLDCLWRGAAKRKLHGEILYVGNQGSDHPIHFAMPETKYLKCIIARFFK